MTEMWKNGIREEKEGKEEGKEREEAQEKSGLLKRALDFRSLKKENFLVLFLMGLLLLVIAVPSSGGEQQKNEGESGITDSKNAILDLTGRSGQEAGELVTDSTGLSEKNTGIWEGEKLSGYYAEEMETALEEILSSMEGAGRVKVMITLRSSAEAVVEKDTTQETGNTTEVDSQGGSRNTAELTKSGETVFENGEGGFSVPYVRQVRSPVIEGVLVCAEGGGNKNINKNITEAIQALFGIDVHKIKVIKMSSRTEGEAD